MTNKKYDIRMKNIRYDIRMTNIRYDIRMTNKKNNYDQPVSVQRQFVRFCISKMCRVFFILELIQLNLSYFTLAEGGWRNMLYEKYEKQLFGNNFY